MPQPYQLKGKLVEGEQAMLLRPELGIRIATVASILSRVENGWAAILSYMLRADARTATTIYLSLTGTAAQMAVLNAIADETLPPALREDFKSLLKAAKGPAGERNAIVHGPWYADAAEPTVLLLGQRDWVPRVLAELHHLLRALPR